MLKLFPAIHEDSLSSLQVQFQFSVIVFNFPSMLSQDGLTFNSVETFFVCDQELVSDKLSRLLHDNNKHIETRNEVLMGYATSHGMSQILAIATTQRKRLAMLALLLSSAVLLLVARWHARSRQAQQPKAKNSKHQTHKFDTYTAREQNRTDEKETRPRSRTDCEADVDGDTVNTPQSLRKHAKEMQARTFVLLHVIPRILLYSLTILTHSQPLSSKRVGSRFRRRRQPKAASWSGSGSYFSASPYLASCSPVSLPNPLGR